MVVGREGARAESDGWNMTDDEDRSDRPGFVEMVNSGADSEKRAAFDAWVQTRPEVVRKVATMWPGWKCYRHRVDPRIHVGIWSYDEDGNITVVHGRDSHLPGLGGHGLTPMLFLDCGCGKFEEATKEQVAATKKAVMSVVQAEVVELPAGEKQTLN